MMGATMCSLVKMILPLLVTSTYTMVQGTNLIVASNLYKELSYIDLLYFLKLCGIVILVNMFSINYLFPGSQPYNQNETESFT